MSQNIYLSGICGNAAEKLPFWRESAYNSPNLPDFPLCFESIVFPLTTLFYVLIMGIFYIPHLSSCPLTNRTWSKFNFLKTAIALIISVLFMVDFLQSLVNDRGSYRQMRIWASLLYAGVSAVASFVIVYEYKKCIHSSSWLFLYWLLSSVIGVIVIRTEYLSLQSIGDKEDQFRSVISIIVFLLIIFNFILHFFADKSALPQSFITPKLRGGRRRQTLNDTYSTDESSVRFSDVSYQDERQPLVNPTTVEVVESNETLRLMIPSPELAASFANKLVFFWMNRLFWNGYQQRPLIETAQYELPREDLCRNLVISFKATWNGLRKSSTPSLVKSLISVFGMSYALLAFVDLGVIVLTFIQPQLLNLFIDFISSSNAPVWRGYALAIGLFLVAMFRTVVYQQYMNTTTVIGMRMRSAVTAFIYRKILLLSNKSKQDTSIGQVMNLMAMDTNRLQEITTLLHAIWSDPLTIVLAVYFLWQQLGPSVLAGVAVILLLIPVNGFLAKKQRTLMMKQMKIKDERMKLMNEILTGIKVLKLNAWEQSFEEKVAQLREQELKEMRRSASVSAISMGLWFCAPFLVTLMTFIVFILSSKNNVLDVNKAFVSLSLFNILNIPLSLLPGMIVGLMQGLVSIKRMDEFLQLEEIPAKPAPEVQDAVDYAVSIRGSFSWGSPLPVVLHDISLDIPRGSLTAIVGLVGSGKSSLLNAFLGEMVTVDGKVQTQGTVALVPQQAWCLNTSVQNNILFGNKMFANRYQTIVSACALDPDLLILPAGDKTEIGENGINLSGGQKQRISLARAVYADRDLYLLDDPLSVVDSHVSKHLFQQVIGPQGLLRDKTRILITHGLTHLPQMDCIVVMKDGRLAEMGSYSKLIQDNGAFAEFIKTFANETTTDSQDMENAADSNGKPTDLIPPAKMNNASKSGEKLMTEETSEIGSVKLRVFVDYLHAAGMLMVVGTSVSFALYLSLSVATNWWLSKWTAVKSINDTQNVQENQLYLGVYAALGFGQSVFVIAENVFVAYAGFFASKLLHDALLKAILRAPMQFFDTTPMGRIINKIGRDINTLDASIPQAFRMILVSSASVLTSVVLISIASPYFLLLMIPLAGLYAVIQRFYIGTSRQLRRMESLLRSPMNSHFQETMTGLVSIRAYNKQVMFTEKSDNKVDEHQMIWYLLMTTNRWLGIQLETIGNITLLLTGLLSVMTRNSGNAGLAAVAVTFALQITNGLYYLVRTSCDLETHGVAVERIFEYFHIDSEAHRETSYRPPAYWPNQGQIEFVNYSTRYRNDLDFVLRDITCCISAGHKVGIVGRTGAGKSSLSLALLRIMEPTSGSIFIDGVNIAQLGLQDLRSAVTIIPQDPVIFSGSIRFNVDPLQQHQDDIIWTVLEQANLKEFVQTQPEGLHYLCSEGGSNLSLGQRQLLCLARALLRKTQILIMDEATAAVDMETDALVQQTIRREFSTCTVLTIAHRLNTIMDHDEVMVLDDGQVVEYDSPQDLIHNENSLFHNLAKDAGLVSTASR